jgi:hypothetical protein
MGIIGKHTKWAQGIYPGRAALDGKPVDSIDKQMYRHKVLKKKVKYASQKQRRLKATRVDSAGQGKT